MKEGDSIAVKDIKKSKLSEHNYFDNSLMETQTNAKTDTQNEDIPMDIDSVSAFVNLSENDDRSNQDVSIRNDEIETSNVGKPDEYFGVVNEVQIEAMRKTIFCL